VEIPKDYVKAREWYEKAVAKGSVEAMDHIGKLYLHGGYGIQQDYAKAREWFEKGAAAGGTDAMRSLADIYWHGYGVEVDNQTADQWRDRADTVQGDRIYHAERLKFEQSAAVGDVPAMNKLGEYYKDGLGVPKDYAKARGWWEKAAATGRTGSLEAMNNLGFLYEVGGPGLKEDDAKAVEWYEKAAAGGYRTAMCNLGRFYDGLSHFQPNPEYPKKSKDWYDKCHEVVNGETMH
jgi:TPR repeat protein